MQSKISWGIWKQLVDICMQLMAQLINILTISYVHKMFYNICIRLQFHKHFKRVTYRQSKKANAF
jgi:hypothetical protein